MRKISLKSLITTILIFLSIIVYLYYYNNNYYLRTIEYKNQETGATETAEVVKLSNNVTAIYTDSLTPDEKKQAEILSKEFTKNFNKFSSSTSIDSSNFVVQTLPEIKGSVQIPKSWQFRHETKDNSNQYYASREQVNKDGESFQTGLSVFVFTNDMIPNSDADMYGNYISNNMKKDSFKKIDLDEVEKVGPITIRTIQYTRTDQNDGFTWTAYNQIVSNSVTNTVYMIVFESPIEKWESDWKKYGKTIVDTFQISLNV